MKLGKLATTFLKKSVGLDTNQKQINLYNLPLPILANIKNYQPSVASGLEFGLPVV